MNIQECNKLLQTYTIEQKYKIWFHYIATQVAIKNNFIIVDLTKESLSGYPKPHKQIHNLCFYWLWRKNFDKFSPILGFDEFCNKHIQEYHWKFYEELEKEK